MMNGYFLTMVNIAKLTSNSYVFDSRDAFLEKATEFAENFQDDEKSNFIKSLSSTELTETMLDYLSLDRQFAISVCMVKLVLAKS